MPNIWTHMLFCEDVSDAVGKTTSLLKNEMYMRLGAQGLDPFFYYNFWPWIKNEPVREIGALLHTKACGPFLIDLVIAAKKMDLETKEYVFGFVTHHILDRITHPFIHYHAGYEENNQQKLAVKIDTLMMQRHHNLKTWKTPVYKEIDIGYVMKKEIVVLIHETIKKHFPEINKNSTRYIQKAYRDMKLALKLLADPYGWKNKLFSQSISAYSHQPIKHAKDYLNLNGNMWYHPATNEPSTKSFIDLYEQARAKGIEIMTEIVNYWSTEQNEGYIVQLIYNISKDTASLVTANSQNKSSQANM